MNKNPKLSIITICYNEPNLEETCESIVNQTWQDFEWIVVDGGSNKETQKIWDKYKYRIDKFISEPDNGVYNAMNKGIKLAQGEFLNFMNAGDSFFDNEVLEKVFKDNTNINDEILYGDMKPINGDYSGIIPFQDKIDKIYLGTVCINHQSTFIKRVLFDKYGLYNEKYKILADLEKWFCFEKNGVKFKHLSHIIANYDMRGLSAGKDSLIKVKKEDNKIKNKYLTRKERQISLEKYGFNQNLKLYFSTLEQIFSIKNSFDKKHKIITLFGIHIKIKRGDK